MLRHRTAWLAMGVIGCAPTLRDQMDESKQEACSIVLDRYDRFSKDPAYGEEPASVRQRFEADAAGCWLNRRQPERALAIVAAWKDPDADIVAKVQARAFAQLAREEEARKAFSMIGPGVVSEHYFLENPEFGPFLEEDWYWRAALNTWKQRQTLPLRQFVGRLLGLARKELLPLAIAAADRDRPPGDWVLWTGVVHETKLDRARKQTVLVVDGAETKERLAMVDRKVTSYGQDWVGNVTPEYAETRTYEEEFVLTGQRFVIRQDGIQERLVGMRGVTVLGRYSGRATDAVPEVSAVQVLPREVKTRTEHAR